MSKQNDFLPLAELYAGKTTLCLGRLVKEARMHGKSLAVLDKKDCETVFPLADIRRIVLTGSPAISLAVIRKCLSLGVPVCWVDYLGRPLGPMAASIRVF